MWVNTYLPALRRYPALGIGASVAAVTAAVLTKLWLPGLPPFLTLFPAILLSALLGGKWTGRIALAACLIAGGYFIHRDSAADEHWQVISYLGFVLAAALVVFVIEQLHTAITRLQIEHAKLELVLHSAGAATWALRTDGELYWDQNFYHLVGMTPRDTPPSAQAFISRVHPDDRAKMMLARDQMARNESPAPVDEYRFIKPDGTVLWFENRRVRAKERDYRFVGITQDITQRKLAEERIQFLVRELTHRVKNQLALVTRIATETRRETATAQDFNRVFSLRMQSLAHSHDLLVKSADESVELSSLLRSQLEGFVPAHRFDATGPDLSVPKLATQYLAMAFHELATNAVKYGSLSAESGRVRVAWAWDGEEFRIRWEETGGPKPAMPAKPGFGTTVLLRLTPSALQGKAELTLADGGLVWELVAHPSGLTASPKR